MLLVLVQHLKVHLSSGDARNNCLEDVAVVGGGDGRRQNEEHDRSPLVDFEKARSNVPRPEYDPR